MVDETIPPPGPVILQPIEHTQELLQEFNNVYNAVHYTNLSRPLATDYGNNNVQVQQFQGNHHQPLNHPTNYGYDQLPVPVLQHSTSVVNGNNTYNNEIQFVDEIIRARCKDLKDQWMTEFDNSSSASSAYSYSLSPAGSDLESAYNGSTGSNDEDFEYFGSDRTKPYDREMGDGEGKHFRKKDQNKNAARKYRQKKKQEVEEILVEERQLTDVHNKLAKECGEIKREVKYLKSLMRELFKSKGVIE